MRHGGLRLSKARTAPDPRIASSHAMCRSRRHGRATQRSGIRRRAWESEGARPLRTIPGNGPCSRRPEPHLPRRAYSGRGGTSQHGSASRPDEDGGAIPAAPDDPRRRSVLIKRQVHASARPGTGLGGVPAPMPVRGTRARIVRALMAQGEAPAAAASAVKIARRPERKRAAQPS